MRSWISRTWSIAALSGVSGVLRMGSAVLTSTSQRVSACAGMGCWDFGSTWGRIRIGVDLYCDGYYLFLLEHEDDQRAFAETVTTFVNLRTSPVSC